MSADLLAEFGQGSGPPQNSAVNPQAGQQQTSSDLDHSGDDFFSSLSTSKQRNRPQNSVSIPPAGQYTIPTSRQPPGFELFNLPRHGDSEVLFDAETDTPANDTEDDWGDFEEPESVASSFQAQQPENVIPKVRPPVAQYQTAQIDLLDSLSLRDSTPTNEKHTALSKKISLPTSKPPVPTWDDDSFGDWDDFTDAPSTNVSASQATAKNPMTKNLTTQTKPAAKTAKIISTAPRQIIQEDDFEDWGDFNDGPAAVAPAPAPIQTPKSISKPSASAHAPSTINPRNFLSSPPTSPPALSKPNLATHTPRKKEETALKIYTTLTTSARIISGRSLRWKRDTILSQSMRIGPAGKQGGMKLSAINKHEDVKESQDAVEVLKLWRDRITLFNAVVQGVRQKPIPVFTDPTALKVVLARAEEGAIKASHACALCALKRDERVLRVDEGDVNDSFGEWWTEHWGHTGCRIFWEKNKDQLLQR
ncbi:hypothetical protein N7454_009609 [Penicillium verhagenii]|nr:hypothetical protein N7454_009609 [Penicillium verhagenii]